ncbi:MAG: hypothetical protein LIP16_23130 [Clostridium sp.]|nr:hypothetical protein [Clostridium sp.]
MNKSKRQAVCCPVMLPGAYRLCCGTVKQPPAIGSVIENGSVPDAVHSRRLDAFIRG